MRTRVNRVIERADGYDDALTALRETIRSAAARLPDSGRAVISAALARHGGTLPKGETAELEEAVVDCTVGPEDETEVLLEIYAAVISGALSAE